MVDSRTIELPPLQIQVLAVVGLTPVVPSQVLVNLLRSDLDPDEKERRIRDHIGRILTHADLDVLLRGRAAAAGPLQVRSAVGGLGGLDLIEFSAYYLNPDGIDNTDGWAPVIRPGDELCILRESGRDWLSSHGFDLHPDDWRARNGISIYPTALDSGDPAAGS